MGGVLLCSSLCQALDQPASLLFSCWYWPVGRESLCWWLHPLPVTQQYHHHLASMVSWLSSPGISHHKLLPHMPLIHLSTVNSTPHHGIAPPSLNFSSQLLCLLGNLYPCLGGMYGCSKDCLIFIPFKVPQISCFTLSLKCFLSDSVAPFRELDPCFSCPTCQGQDKFC